MSRMKQLKKEVDGKLTQEISDMKKKAHQDTMRVRIRLNKDNEIDIGEASCKHDNHLKVGFVHEHFARVCTYV